jgi:hypothetical protein
VLWIQSRTAGYAAQAGRGVTCLARAIVPGAKRP